MKNDILVCLHSTGGYPARPGSRLPQETTPTAAQNYMQRQNSYPATANTPSVPPGSNHYYSQQNSVPPNASPFPQPTANPAAAAAAAAAGFLNP